MSRGGHGEASIAKPQDEITLYDIYKAVGCVDDDELFHFHENPNPACPVGRNIHASLDERLEQVQKAMEDSLKSMKLSDVIKDTKNRIHEEEQESQ